MSNYISAILIASLTSAGALALAQQKPKAIKVVAMQQTDAASGQQMYTSYCAACHGANASGNGPAAPALKLPPTDLTTLSQKNHGVFPATHVASVLEEGSGIPAHGSADMPVWGTLLRSMAPVRMDSTPLVRQRIFNLTNYLKQIQK